MNSFKVTRKSVIEHHVRHFMKQDGQVVVKLETGELIGFEIDYLVYVAHQCLRKNPHFLDWLLPAFAPVTAENVGRALQIAAYYFVMFNEKYGDGGRRLEFPHCFLFSIEELELPLPARRFLAYHSIFYLGDLVALGENGLERFSRDWLGWNGSRSRAVFGELIRFDTADCEAWPIEPPAPLGPLHSARRTEMLLDLPIAATELDAPIVRRLQAAGLKTVRCVLGEGYWQVRRIPNVGPASAVQISQTLAGLGFVFDHTIFTGNGMPPRMPFRLQAQATDCNVS